jgi:MFS family permease
MAALPTRQRTRVRLDTSPRLRPGLKDQRPRLRCAAPARRRFCMASLLSGSGDNRYRSRPCAVPGYFVAAAMMDRMGRKTIQILGFAMMALSFAAIALIPGIEKLVYPFLIVYGISYFFTEFGPNATTFVYPAELFPVAGRTTGHGIALATGKLGGFIGVFLFPILLSAGGFFGLSQGR